MAKKSQVDGFVPRRSTGMVGGRLHDSQPAPTTVSPYGIKRQGAPSGDSEHTAGKRGVTVSEHGLSRHESGVSRSDIDESLRDIDEQQSEAQVASRKHGSGKRRKRIILFSVILLLLVGAGITGWVGLRAVLASNSIFKGDIFGLVQQKKLAQDTAGRTNILIFGTSEDDEGGEHPGAFLTDSIMVLSVDQTKKDAFMVSIPRDLWVDFGTACNQGYKGKINELFGCFSNNGEDQPAGELALAKKVGEVTGLAIQYRAHVNYTVVRQAVDAVGGVDVKVETPDPNGILDRNFDWKCNYQCYYVKYKQNELAHMDGEHALAFMRARNAQGGYGLPNGNFDREKNQQKVLLALRQKSLSAGTLANPSKVASLIDALGNNLNTNFETSEIRTLMSLGNSVQASAITSISLIDEKEPVMTTGNLDGISIVRPIAGLMDYSDVTQYIKKQMRADAATREGAKIAVLNGSGVVGAAKIAADKLSDEGYTIDSVANAPAGTYERRSFYARDESSSPATRAKLVALYGKPTIGLDQFSVADDVEFVIVVGQADSATQ